MPFPGAGDRARRRGVGRGRPGSRPGPGAVLRSAGGVRRRSRPPPDAVPFYGTHQAGIVTPAQDRLHFVAFDVITRDRARLVEMLQEWTAAAARMTAGHDAGAFGAVGGEPQAPPDDTGEALGLPAVAADPDHWLRTVAVPGRRRPGPVRARRAATAGPGRPAALSRRRAPPGDLRRGPLRTGVRQRPAGGGARHPQPGPDRHGGGQRPLVPAGLRAYLVDLPRPGHPAQPVRLQGRHGQPQG